MIQAAVADARPSRRFIGVLADDLSGASEIAGAALRYGLSAEVTTDSVMPVGAKVCCVDANTRSVRPDEAAVRAGQMAFQLQAAGVDWIFKKTDSLLRGNVRREIEAVLGVTGQPRCLLCPANPDRGRVVTGGRYFVGGVPLEQTVFARDTTHPRHTSVVTELLGDPSPWVSLPDVRSRDDLRAMAGQLANSTLPAGGVEFFEEILAARGYRRSPATLPALGGIRLFVCGSPAAWSAGRERLAAKHGVATVRLDPRAVANAERELQSAGQVLLAIGDAQGDPGVLGETLARAVAILTTRYRLDLAFLEGGATAIAVLRHLGWTRLRAVAEIAPGTVLLEDSAGRLPRLVIKPGSYPWPEHVWNRTANYPS